MSPIGLNFVTGLQKKVTLNGRQINDEFKGAKT